MSLPSGYSVRTVGLYLVLYAHGRELHARKDGPGAAENLLEVAEWAARERAATVAAWSTPMGSEEQATAYGLREEAEKMKERAMGARWR